MGNMQASASCKKRAESHPLHIGRLFELQLATVFDKGPEN